jgi:hypothetical protein
MAIPISKTGWLFYLGGTSKGEQNRAIANFSTAINSAISRFLSKSALAFTKLLQNLKNVLKNKS